MEEYMEPLWKNIWLSDYVNTTAQKMKFSIKDFFKKCDQIRRKLFCSVTTPRNATGLER